jgi:Gluconate 2-dehydrogenase subunit 3
MTQEAVTRRTVLKTLGVGAGAVAFLPWLSEKGLAAFVEVQRSAAPPTLRALSASQYATVEALAEAIIPADERSPGAKEARVADYIDLLLAEQDETVRQAWLDGLVAFEAEASRRFGSSFAQLAPAHVEELLTDLSRNERPAAGVEQTLVENFFVQAKKTTIDGYYTSEIGIHRELRYKGNQVLPEFVGCQTQDGKDCPHCGQKAEA